MFGKTHDLIAWVAVPWFVASCAGPRVEPHSAGTLGHERTSREHAMAGLTHAQQAEAACGSDRMICWTTPAHGPHAAEARRHDELAGEHAVAGVELAEEERRACARVAAEDRELGAFGHPYDIATVAAIDEGDHLRGARIVFQVVPGLTEERLRDLVACERAELASRGHPSDAASPLAPRGARATVTTAGDRLAVDVIADDPAEAEAILARARRLDR